MRDHHRTLTKDSGGTTITGTLLGRQMANAYSNPDNPVHLINSCLHEA
jgi:hypothetical protein